MFNFKNVTVLTKAQQKKVTGGVSREEYCDTLRTMLLGGNYQGDMSWGMHVFHENCGKHGIPLY